MVYVKRCEYDLDTGKLEMEDVDGVRYSIDVYAVEDLCADTMYERSSLDDLLYNEPVEYVNLLLAGELRDYFFDGENLKNYFVKDEAKRIKSSIFNITP